MIVGIDLGTTNSVVACMTEDGPQLTPNSLGKNLMPSVVGFELDGHLLVGRSNMHFKDADIERLFKHFLPSIKNTNAYVHEVVLIFCL